MIVFENAGGAPCRRGEYAPLRGVSGRVRAIPYAGHEPAGADPWSGSYRAMGQEGRIGVASDSPAAWAEALRTAPAGTILLGPVPEAEAVYGAAAAAIEAAGSLGRGVVVIDAAVPLSACDIARRDLVAVAVWRCGEEERLWRGASARQGGLRLGVALPLLPGWTAEASFIGEFLRRCRDEGFDFAVPMEIEGDGPSRAAVHGDFSRLFPDRGMSYFDRIHHGDWPGAVREAKRRFEETAAALGVLTRVPRPRGAADFESNLRAIEGLEQEADQSDEPRASRLRRAVRLIEDLGRDLDALAREGNGRLLFPPDSPEWRLIELALGASQKSSR